MLCRCLCRPSKGAPGQDAFGQKLQGALTPPTGSPAPSAGAGSSSKGGDAEKAVEGRVPESEPAGGSAAQAPKKTVDVECLLAGTPWEDEVEADKRDLDDFRVARELMVNSLDVSSSLGLVLFLLTLVGAILTLARC